jgi:hypothetical protein
MRNSRIIDRLSGQSYFKKDEALLRSTIPDLVTSAGDAPGLKRRTGTGQREKDALAHRKRIVSATWN